MAKNVSEGEVRPQIFLKISGTSILSTFSLRDGPLMIQGEARANLRTKTHRSSSEEEKKILPVGCPENKK